jgi:hypothetical protein
METNPIYATTSGIRTYPRLFEGRNVVYIHYMFGIKLYSVIYVRREDREWMYTGHERTGQVNTVCIRKTDDFVERAFGEAVKGVNLVPCSCSKMPTRKEKQRRPW